MITHCDADKLCQPNLVEIMYSNLVHYQTLNPVEFQGSYLPCYNIQTCDLPHQLVFSSYDHYKSSNSPTFVSDAYKEVVIKRGVKECRMCVRQLYKNPTFQINFVFKPTYPELMFRIQKWTKNMKITPLRARAIDDPFFKWVQTLTGSEWFPRKIKVIHHG